MNKFSELFEGGTPQMQKKKKVTFAVMCVTAALIAAMILFLAIFGIASLLSKNKKLEGENEPANIGSTTTITLSENNLYSGNLLVLDENNTFKGTPSLVNLQSYSGRSKKTEQEGGGNTYTILSANRTGFMATDAAASALNKMLGAFYKSAKDDNIFIAAAYNKTDEDTQKAVYSSGEAFEHMYFHDYDTNKMNDQRSIAGVQLYSWIYTNAYKYGFVTVGGSDSNVFRYVGIVHSNAMKQNNLSFDQYIENIKQYTPDSPLKVTASGVSYAISFLAKDAEHIIPEKYEYTVSGNNVDGYIITVNLSKKVTN